VKIVKYITILGFLALTLGFAAVTNRVDAFSSGILGYSGNPGTNSGNICTICHSSGTLPTVSLTGPTDVAPGSTNSYTLVISGGQQSAGGLDVSATAGTLMVNDAGTQLLGAEITHVAPRLVNGSREVVFTFAWQAPVLPGNTILYAAGNSVDFQGGTNGDNAAATSLQISVQAASGTPGESSTDGLAPLLATGYDNSTDELSISFESGCETDGNNIYYGDLSQVSTMSWSGESCDVGTFGTAAFSPGTGSYFFVVVGNKAGTEGSYGRSSAGLERAPFALAFCGETQDISDACLP
jgi:hypothetical protein